ncbi:MAG TPA: aminoglycoside phosphotransferase family protein [Streptosporangiaceae bacterium]|jgi:aminoglycoside phosphotransferase (APT) family kinase protein
MVETTHRLTLTSDRVIKRFRSWDQGEPGREWAGLVLLQRYAPGCAPRPLERRTEDGAPAIVMTRLPGEPLGAGPLTPDQLAALSRALRVMHEAVPAEALARLPERRWGPAELWPTVRAWAAEPAATPGRTIAAALRAAGAWLGSADAAACGGPLAERVFAHADGNAGNFIWDGAQCGVVDFEDCGISDPAYEAADLIEHASVSLPGLIDPDDFLAALGFSRGRRERLLRFRRLMATYWLLMLLPGHPGHARNPPGSLDRQAARVLGLLARRGWPR